MKKFYKLFLIITLSQFSISTYAAFSAMCYNTSSVWACCKSNYWQNPVWVQSTFSLYRDDCNSFHGQELDYICYSAAGQSAFNVEGCDRNGGATFGGGYVLLKECNVCSHVYGKQ